MATHAKDFEYLWEPQPQAAAVVTQCVEQAAKASTWLASFRERLKNETGTRLVDWIDHLVVPDLNLFRDAGFESSSRGYWAHPLGLFPKVLLDPTLSEPALGLKVEAIRDFLHAMEFVDGEAHWEVDTCRLRLVDVELGDARLRVVERHGQAGFEPQVSEVEEAAMGHASSNFADRPRNYHDPGAAFEVAHQLFAEAESALGRDHACEVFFRSEREFWQARNRAAQIQFRRQQRLGLGWANHDHHTYRCSRQWFAPLVRLLERMGFACRERFYAGREAGWGAQVLEHAECGVVIFADVDMTEDEVKGDFAHNGLPPRSELGTVGLWCQLHGDSFVSAGMHHLECQFDFDAARQQLATEGVDTMAPFTDFPYLRQAFTQGESWVVDEERLHALHGLELITQEEADRFGRQGAIGSHLEILERNDGYKGFNQTGISQIILETNPKSALR